MDIWTELQAEGVDPALLEEASRYRVHIDVHRDIPQGAAEHRRQILRQHIFTRGLGAREQQVLPAEQSGDRALPDLLTKQKTAYDI